MLIGNQRKLLKWKEKMHPFCCYSSSDNVDCHSTQATRKKYANNIECTLDFYYSSEFYMATSLVLTHGMHAMTLMHVYLFGASTNRMLI